MKEKEREREKEGKKGRKEEDNYLGYGTNQKREGEV